MSIDNTAQLILAWTTDVGRNNHPAMENPSYITDLTAMARLWLMRKQLLKFFADLDSADKTESWAWNISERLRKDMEALETE